MTFPAIESILLKCLHRPPIGAVHIPEVISNFDNARELVKINQKKNNYFYELHTHKIVYLDLDFKMQSCNRLLFDVLLSLQVLS